jgi:hypothetical protein
MVVIRKRLYAHPVDPLILTPVPVTVGHAVAQFVEALLYKPEGHGFDFSLT